MTREQVRIATSVVFATIGLAIAVGIGPISRETIFAAYVLVLAAIALAALTRVLRSRSDRAVASPFESALRVRPAETIRPPELVRTERAIMLGTGSAGHLELRLLPLLRETAAARLAATRTIDLERNPAAARRVLGDDAWDLLRPDRPEPDDRNAPGVPLKRLRTAIDVLEAL